MSPHNITIIVIKAMAPVLDATGRQVKNADGTWAYTGCPPCIALKNKQMPELETLAARSGGRISVVEIDKPTLGSPINPDTPEAIASLNIGWFPCVMATPTKDWNASLHNKRAPMAIDVYNGRRDGKKWVGQSKPLTAALIFQWAEALCHSLDPMNPNASDEHHPSKTASTGGSSGTDRNVAPTGGSFGTDRNVAPRPAPAQRPGAGVSKRPTAHTEPSRNHYRLTDNRNLPRRPL